MSEPLALALAALAGATTMALELLASRWLAPAFGATLSTWSLLIAATLLAGRWDPLESTCRHASLSIL